MITFKQYLLIESGDIPQSSYGYWISTDGIIYPVNYGHDDEIKRISNYHNAYHAVDNGYVRVAIWGAPKRSKRDVVGIDFELCQTEVPKKAEYNALKVLKALYEDGADMRIDLIKKGGDVISTDHFFDIKQAIRRFNQFIKTAT